MSEILQTLRKKNDTSVEVYPNIKSDNIPADAITTAKILDGAVTEDKIGTGSVTSSKIGDGSILITKIGFHLYEHIYNCYCSSPANNFIIRFVSTHAPFGNSAEIFQYLYDTYGVGSPVAISKNGQLSDIFGYVSDNENLEFKDSGDETYNCSQSNTVCNDCSHMIF